MLQAFKNPVQNTGLVPSAHAHVDSMPVPEPFREPPPFAPIFHDIQNGIEHLKVVVGDIASMDGETIRYTLVLHLADLHHTTILTYFDPFDNILSEHTLNSPVPNAGQRVGKFTIPLQKPGGISIFFSMRPTSRPGFQGSTATPVASTWFQSPGRARAAGLLCFSRRWFCPWLLLCPSRPWRGS